MNRYFFLLWMVFSAFSHQGCAENSEVTFKLHSNHADDTSHNASLDINIPSDWHVSAPSPQPENTTGFDPSLSWQDSKNISAVTLTWPKGKLKVISDHHLSVYDHNISIPLKIISQHNDKASTLSLHVSLLACSTLCVPIEKDLILQLPPLKPKKETSFFSFIELIGFALLGGMILNFMPCVLPVLSLKILSMIKQSGKASKAKARKGFLVTALGIISSFLCLAFFLLILKMSGESVGWGMHFQNPIFLCIIFVILIFFSVSLFGFFEINLPPFIGNWLVDHEGQGVSKDFFSGVFSTLLATPCSAPFVGTAVSFALAGSHFEIILIFLCLGIGFSSPYFLAIFLPEKWIILPKPGPWMIWLQQFMGLCLFATACWIISILSYHISLNALGLMIGLILCAVIIFWLKQYRFPNLYEWALALPLLGAAIIIPVLYEKNTPSIAKTLADKSVNLSIWQPFNPHLIPQLVAQGKTVFVDVTARWCVTCGVNKKLVLNQSEIMTLLSDTNVIAMQTDWTTHDKEITQYLQSFGRYGIPFNVVYGPQAHSGIILPELLTNDSVQTAFKKAGFLAKNSLSPQTP